MGWLESYSTGTDCVPAVGHWLSDESVALHAPHVQALLQDTIGTAEVRRSLQEVTRTDFRNERLTQILSATGVVDEWRAGEALAEYHLTDEHACIFPWPSGRDLKNPGTSSGGVDLIGFDLSEAEAALALGEVKTSRQQVWPPSVMTSRHGLEKQIEGLRDGDKRKDWAVKYIAIHAVGKDWHGIYQQAMVRYLDDPEDVRLYGTLVHLSDPNESDLRLRAANLTKGCPDKTQIKLTAIYVSGSGLQALAGGQIQWETQE